MVFRISEFFTKQVVIFIIEKSIDFTRAEVLETDLDGDVFCHRNEIFRAEICLDRLFDFVGFSLSWSLIFSREQLRENFFDIWEHVDVFLKLGEDLGCAPVEQGWQSRPGQASIAAIQKAHVVIFSPDPPLLFRYFLTQLFSRLWKGLSLRLLRFGRVVLLGLCLFRSLHLCLRPLSNCWGRKGYLELTARSLDACFVCCALDFSKDFV